MNKCGAGLGFKPWSGMLMKQVVWMCNDMNSKDWFSSKCLQREIILWMGNSQGGKIFFTTDVPRAHPYFFRCARIQIRAHPGLRAHPGSIGCALIEKRRILAFQILLLTLNCPWKINGVKIKSFCRKEKINLVQPKAAQVL